MNIMDGIYGLVKAASLLRGDARTAYLVGEMQKDREENRLREQIYGPMQSNGIAWNGPRQLPSGNVTAMLEQQGPTRPGENALPAIPKTIFSPVVKAEGVADLKQRLLAMPAYQKLAEAQMFAPPKPPQIQKLGANEVAGYADDNNNWVEVARNAAPEKPPEETELAKYQRELDAFGPNDPRRPTWQAKIKRLSEGEPKDAPETWSLMSAEGAAAKGLPKGGTYEMSTRGQTRAVVNPTKEMGPAAMKLANAEIGAKGILYGLDKFEEAIRTAPDGAKMEAFFGGLTPEGQKLNTAWTNAALLAKGEDLYNLGVLSGPDLQIIQGALPDPSSKGGALKDRETYYKAIGEVRNLVNQRLATARSVFGGEGGAKQDTPPPSGTLTKPKDAPADARQAKDGKWYSPDPIRPGKYILWE